LFIQTYLCFVIEDDGSKDNTLGGVARICKREWGQNSIYNCEKMVGEKKEAELGIAAKNSRKYNYIGFWVPLSTTLWFPRMVTYPQIQ
jgi:hypothetical protein